MRVLTTPIDLPARITKVDLIKYILNEDDADPVAVLTIQFYGPGNVPYNSPMTITASDAGQCTIIHVNPAATGFQPRIIAGTSARAGSYTAVENAVDAAVGSRAAKRDAALGAAYAAGLIDPLLAAT